VYRYFSFNTGYFISLLKLETMIYRVQYVIFAQLLVKVPQPGDSKVTFSIFRVKLRLLICKIFQLFRSLVYFILPFAYVRNFSDRK